LAGLHPYGHSRKVNNAPRSARWISEVKTWDGRKGIDVKSMTKEWNFAMEVEDGMAAMG